MATLHRFDSPDDRIEQVPIEAICVGDYVYLTEPTRQVNGRCVIAKQAKSNARTERVVGWLVELSDGELAWWTHGDKLWRRRIA